MKKPITYRPGMPFPALQYCGGDGTIGYVTVSPVWVGGFLIPEGFEFDGNSAPRFLFWLIARDDCLAAACIHDYIYRGPGQMLMLADGIKQTRLRVSADSLWHYIQVSNGTHRVRVSLGYVGLRLFGRSNFQKIKVQSPS